MAKTRRKRSHGSRRRRRHRVRHVRRNPTMRAKKRWHHKGGRFSYNARHRRRRSRGFRRNPFAVRGVVGQLTEAAKRAAVIVIAQAATNRIAALIPIGDATSVPLTIAKQAGVGLLLAGVSRKFVPRYASDVLVGALIAPATTILRQVPVIGPGLSGAPPGLGRVGLWDGRVTRTPLRGAPPGLGRVGRWTEGAAKANGGGLPESSYYD